jgi:hypothetical protein
MTFGSLILHPEFLPKRGHFLQWKIGSVKIGDEWLPAMMVRHRTDMDATVVETRATFNESTTRERGRTVFHGT